MNSSDLICIPEEQVNTAMNQIKGKFTSSKMKQLTKHVVTRWYRAPECALRTYYYGPASDIFAIGCVFAELFLGMPIFPGSSELNQVDTIFKILGTPSKN